MFCFCNVVFSKHKQRTNSKQTNNKDNGVKYHFCCTILITLCFSLNMCEFKYTLIYITNELV